VIFIFRLSKWLYLPNYNVFEKMSLINANRLLKKRIYATVFDYGVIWIFTILFTVEFGKSNGIGGYLIDGWMFWIPSMFWFFYLVVVECYAHATAGHLIFNIKVESLSDQKITLKRIFKRRICDVFEISCCFGLIAYLVAKYSKNNQRLGDKIAKTCIIGKNESLVDFQFEFEKK
jgi:uncharacterized RDD family membrane protein YckC